MNRVGHRGAAAVARGAALLLALLVGGLATASTAGAHATLLESVPANGATLDRAPERVELTFNEAVEAKFGAFRVVDARGDRVDDDTIGRPTKQRLAVGLRPGLPDGSYAATYRVVSADGHPIVGGISFAIGAPSAGGAVDVSRVLTDAAAPAGIGTALSVARAARYAGIAAVVGLVAFLLVAWRPVRRAGETAETLTRPIDRWARAAALLGAVGVAATFVLQGANVAGTGVIAALKPAAWGDVARTHTGLWLLVALGLLLVLAVLLPRAAGALRAGRVTAVTATVVGLTLLLAATPALGGHAAASHPAGPMVVLQTVHVVAIGAWLGGLLLLGLLLRTVRSETDVADSRTRLRVALLHGFGPLAIGSVLALIVAGVVLSIVQLSAVSDLIDSAYGRAILLKALLTAAAVAVALVQRRRMTPRVAAALAGTSSDTVDRTIRRLIAVEVGLLAAVLAATGALAGYGQPGRTSSAAASAAPVPAGPVVREVTVDGQRLLRIELDPGVVGANDITVRAVGIDGRPDRQGRDLRVRLTGPDRQQLDPPLRRASRGRWVARGVPLAPAGTWSARIQLRTSAFDEDDVVLEVPVR